MAPTKNQPITSFDFAERQILAKKYAVVSRLGSGWEAEVYLLRELATGIERAGKFFFPQRNKRNKTLNFYAKKLHKLRNCPALIQYLTQETIHYEGHEISFLVSDYVEGEMLTNFLKTQPGKRLDVFQGLHLLHHLCLAVEDIHRHRDYHGDLHAGNVIIRRHGLGFEVKLLDFFHWGSPSPTNIRDDISDLIDVFYWAIGGQGRYAQQPQVIKAIILGRRRPAIFKKFRTITQLREHLENLDWDSVR